MLLHATRYRKGRTFRFCNVRERMRTGGGVIVGAMKTTFFDFLHRRFAWAAGVVAVAGLMAGAAGVGSTASAPLVLKHDNQSVSRGQLEKASYSDIVKRVAPSVVK